MSDTINVNEEIDKPTFHNIDNLVSQLAQIQKEKQKGEEEFGIQRAKMKELFLQKEGELKQQSAGLDILKKEIKLLQEELDETKSHLTVAQLEYHSKLEEESKRSRDEVSSLQRLLEESLEESSRYYEEGKILQSENERLKMEINEIKGSIKVDTGGDMPQILSVPGTVLSSFARKVTSQITTQLSGDQNNSSLSQSQESEDLENSMRKAQQDAEVMRSLVIPLEEEITVLKDKLRTMDNQLNEYKRKENNNLGKNNQILNSFSPELLVENSSETGGKLNVLSVDADSSPTRNSNSLEESTDDLKDKEKGISCDNCINYESQLLNAQHKIYDLERHISTLERYKQELCKETAFRKDMEEKWSVKKEEYKEQVATLQEKTNKADESLKELRQTYTHTYTQVMQELRRLRDDRKRVQLEIERVQEENDKLIGKHSKHSRQLHSEVINLPDKVEELHEIILKYQEELIMAKVAKETAEETINSLRYEAQLLEGQIQSEQTTRMEIESKLTNDIEKLRNDARSEIEKRDQRIELYQSMERDYNGLKENIQGLNAQLQVKKHYEDIVNELRSRVTSLQTELDNSETVQKDFVLLSQSLQQELERIREDGKQVVRWEHEEDVIECPKCRNGFSVTKRKQHCRHCGRIFCVSCLSHTVNSGPNNRPSKVCDVCHTLLVRDTAPYFSTVPPLQSS